MQMYEILLILFPIFNILRHSEVGNTFMLVIHLCITVICLTILSTQLFRRMIFNIVICCA